LESLTLPRVIRPDPPQPGVRRRVSGLAPPGFTLLEIIVVLLLMGVGLSLAVPAVSRRPPEPDPVQRVFDLARRTAVHRAETLQLSIGTDGQWTIDSQNPGESVVASGRIVSAVHPNVTVRVSALGGCTVEYASAPIVLDPIRCMLQKSNSP
jgi:prepilin-type N-terminal cleavage/methylation domain-containing protein